MSHTRFPWTLLDHSCCTAWLSNGRYYSHNDTYHTTRAIRMKFHCTVYRHLLNCDSQVRDGVVIEVERKTLAGQELGFRWLVVRELRV